MSWTRIALGCFLILAGAATAQEPVYEGKPLSEWLKILKNGEVVDRRAAAALLGQRLSPDSRDCAVQLAAAMKDTDRKVRQNVVKALLRIGQEGQKQALIELFSEVQNLSTDKKYQAVRALGDMGLIARPIGGQLFAYLQNTSSDKMLQAACYRTICLLDTRAGKELLIPMLNGLKDPLMEVRFNCAEGLAEIGLLQTGKVVPALISALQDSRPEVRIAAARALGKIDRREVVKCVPPLVGILKDTLSTAALRQLAAECLGEFGPAARSAVEQLKSSMKDADPQVRHATAVAIFTLDSKVAVTAVVPVLVEDLKDSSSEIRQSAADTLKLLGPDAKMAVPALIASLKNDGSNFAVYTTVLDAIAGIGEPAVPSLVGLLNDAATEPTLARAAIDSLGRIGKPAANAGAPALAAVLQDKRRVLLQKFAVAALGRLGAGALPALKPLLKDDEARVRLLAVQALAEIGSDAKPLAADLKAMAKNDADESVRTAAQAAAKRLDPFGKP